MLDYLRRSASSLVVKAMLLLLILSFAAWGIGDIFTARSSGVAVATVGKTDITVERFRSEFSRELQRVSEILGQPITREQAMAMGVDGMLLQRLVNSQVMQEGAKDFGLLPSDQVVLSEIRTNDEFFNDAGQFDRRVFTEVLSRAGLSEDMYVARVREAVARQQFLSPIADGAQAPDVLVNTLYKRISETRVLDVVRITHAKVSGIAAPTDEQLAAYHTEHAQNFMAPEYRSLTALVLTADDMAKNITVSPQELATAYEERAAEFTTPEIRALSQILVKEEAAAKQAVELLDAGKNVTEVIAAVGANPARVKLGVFTRADAAALSSDIADAAFTPAKGGHSAPVKSPLGWHVLIVDDVTPGDVRLLEEVKDTLLDNLRAERALTHLFETSNQLEDLLGGGQTLEEAATALGVTLVKLSDVDANGVALADGKPVDAPYAPELIAKSFELSAGSDSQMIETEDNMAFFVVRADAVTPSALHPLDTVKTLVAAQWMQDQQAAKAAQLAEDIKARLTAGENAKAVAQSLGFDAFTTEPFNRLGNGLEQGALPATLIEDSFALKSNEVTLAPGTGAHTVARLVSVTEAPIDPADALYKAIHDQALQGLQADLAAQLSNALQERFPVSVNQNALNDLAN